MNYEKTTVEIGNAKIVKAMCATRGITLKEYLNELISRDAVNWGDMYSIPYYKQN